MARPIQLLLLLALTAISLPAQIALKPSDFDLKGKVHTVEMKQFVRADFQRGDSITGKENSIVVFDTAGRVVSRDFSANGGTAIRTYEIHNGLLETEVTKKNTGMVIDSTSYEYDGRLLIKSTKYNLGKLLEISKYHYDDSARVQSIETDWFHNDEVTSTAVHTREYDDKGNHILDNVSQTYRGMNPIDSKIYFECNERGLRTSAKRYFASKKIRFRQNLRYDDHDNLIRLEAINYNNDGSMKKKEVVEYFYIYDDRGNWVRKMEISEGRKGDDYAFTRKISYH